MVGVTSLPLTFSAMLVDDATGEHVGYLLSDIPKDAPHEVREGLARRRIAALAGRCPCGATVTLPSRAARRRAVRQRVSLRIVVEHEDGCPATEQALTQALRRWAS